MDDWVDRAKILDLWRNLTDRYSAGEAEGAGKFDLWQQQSPKGHQLLSLKLCPKCRALTVHRRMRSAWAFLGRPDTVKCMECVRGR